MEPRGCNQWQMARPRRPLEQAKTVAVGCDRLPESFHGKGRVDPTSLLLKRGSPPGLRKGIGSAESSSVRHRDREINASGVVVHGTRVGSLALARRTVSSPGRGAQGMPLIARADDILRPRELAQQLDHGGHLMSPVVSPALGDRKAPSGPSNFDFVVQSEADVVAPALVRAFRRGAKPLHLLAFFRSRVESHCETRLETRLRREWPHGPDARTDG